jgi:DNA-binding transcriptional LysR family regulator
MYNAQLDTFLCVADAGSFNKAAGILYISPSAVIKQINLLEAKLGVKLFVRTHRGLLLTPAGQSLYKDARYIIRYCREAAQRAQNAMTGSVRVVRVGTSLLTPAEVLLKLWPRMQKTVPDLKYQLVPFENTPDDTREILAGLGVTIDVIAGMFDDQILSVRRCAGMELFPEPLMAAVPIRHPLAEKDTLVPDDFDGQKVLLIHNGFSSAMDSVRRDLENNHPSVQIEDFDFYDLNVFNRCENTDSLMIAVPQWKRVHPLLKLIPVQWNHTVSFGLMYSLKPSLVIQEFLEAARSAQVSSV